MNDPNNMHNCHSLLRGLYCIEKEKIELHSPATHSTSSTMHGLKHLLAKRHLEEQATIGQILCTPPVMHHTTTLLKSTVQIELSADCNAQHIRSKQKIYMSRYRYTAGCNTGLPSSKIIKLVQIQSSKLLEIFSRSK